MKNLDLMWKNLKNKILIICLWGEKDTQQNLGAKAKVLKEQIFQYRPPDWSGALKV